MESYQPKKVSEILLKIYENNLKYTNEEIVISNIVADKNDVFNTLCNLLDNIASIKKLDVATINMTMNMTVDGIKKYPVIFQDKKITFGDFLIQNDISSLQLLQTPNMNYYFNNERSIRAKRKFDEMYQPKEDPDDEVSDMEVEPKKKRAKKEKNEEKKEEKKKKGKKKP
jgi:hypothetical protein